MYPKILLPVLHFTCSPCIASCCDKAQAPMLRVTLFHGRSQDSIHAYTRITKNYGNYNCMRFDTPCMLTVRCKLWLPTHIHAQLPSVYLATVVCHPRFVTIWTFKIVDFLLQKYCLGLVWAQSCKVMVQRISSWQTWNWHIPQIKSSSLPRHHLTHH